MLCKQLLEACLVLLDTSGTSHEGGQTTEKQSLGDTISIRIGCFVLKSESVIAKVTPVKQHGTEAFLTVQSILLDNEDRTMQNPRDSS